MSSFVQRKLDVSFTLGTGSFGGSGADTKTLSGLRISAHITRAGGPAMSTLQLAVYGMSLSDMKELSRLGLIATTQRVNSVNLFAGDDASGMSLVFSGTIYSAYGDFDGSPDVPFRVDAQTGGIESVIPMDPITHPGSADVSGLMNEVATAMNANLEPNDVNAKTQNPYTVGSPRAQAWDIVRKNGLEWTYGQPYTNDGKGTLAIWTPGSARNHPVISISKETGLVGYPSYTSNGLLLRTLWNPKLWFGNPITVQSVVLPTPSENPTLTTPGNESIAQSFSPGGKWVVYSLDDDLESMVPNGKWFSTLQAAPLGTGPFVPSGG